jgi:hypothetical protein
VLKKGNFTRTNVDTQWGYSEFITTENPKVQEMLDLEADIMSGN